MSDDKATINRQAAQIALLRDALERLTAVASRYLPDYNEHPNIQDAEAALSATEQDVEAWEKSKRDAVIGECQDAAHNAIHDAVELIGLCQEVKAAVSESLEDLKDTKP